MSSHQKAEKEEGVAEELPDGGAMKVEVGGSGEAAALIPEQQRAQSAKAPGQWHPFRFGKY